MAEQWLLTPPVAGSNPVTSTIITMISRHLSIRFNRRNVKMVS